MTTIAASTGVLGQQAQQNPYHDAFRDVDMQDFLDMMIAELQCQDPLNPMDNTQILEQIGQIRETVANDRLTETLEATFLGQNLTAASSLIGEWVAATDEDNTVLAAGQVEQVSIENDVPKLHVGNKVMKLEDVSHIQSEADAEKVTLAMSLIDGMITGIADALPGQLSQQVTGYVTRVSLSQGVPKLHVEIDPRKEDATEYTVDLNNVIEIVEPSTEPAGET
jgi:flagellar basal-body rod modification protein FlgD